MKKIIMPKTDFNTISLEHLEEEFNLNPNAIVLGIGKTDRKGLAILTRESYRQGDYILRRLDKNITHGDFWVSKSSSIISLMEKERAYFDFLIFDDIFEMSRYISTLDPKTT